MSSYPNTFLFQLHFSVSAEINPGIIKFKKNTKDFERWLKLLEESFSVILERNHSVYVRGSLEDVLKFEQYLENEFPEDPRVEDTLVDIYRKATKQEYDAMVHFQVCKDFLDSKDIRCQTYQAGIHIKVKRGSQKAVEQTIDQFLSQLLHEKVKFESTNLAEDAVKIVKKTDNVFVLNEESVVGVFSLNRLRLIDTFRKLIKQNGSMLIYMFEINLFGLKVKLFNGDLQNADAECIVISTPQRIICMKGAAKGVQAILGEGFEERCKKSLKEKGDLNVAECREIISGLGYRHTVAIVRMPFFRDRRETKDLNDLHDGLLSCLKQADSVCCQSMAMACLASGTVRLMFLVIYLCKLSLKRSVI